MRRWVLAVLAVTVAVYAPVLDHEFQYDDLWKIVENPALLEPMSLVEGLAKPGYEQSAARFLPNLTLALNRAWFGLDPLGYNLTNLLFHLANVCLVWLLGVALSRRWGDASGAVPLLGAAIFAVHPLNSEAVNYCNARPNLMVTTFYLATLVLVLDATEENGWGRGARVARWLGAVVCLAAALLSKELAVTAFLMIPVVLLWSSGPQDASRAGFPRRWLAPTVAVVIAGIVVLSLTGLVETVTRHLVASGSERAGSWVIYLIATAVAQSVVFLRYLGLGLVPLPNLLNVDHGAGGPLQDRWFADGEWTGQPLSVLIGPLVSVVALLLGLWVLFRLRRRYPFATFCGLWIFVTHVPTSLMPRKEAMVEYRTYLPMVGFCLLVVWLLRQLALQVESGRPARREAMRVAAIALVIVLALTTTWRNPVWSTHESLWRDALAKSPENPRAWNALGRVAMDQGEVVEAESRFRRALELEPEYGDALANLGGALARQGRQREAFEVLGAAASRAPENAEVQNNLGNLRAERREFELAARHYARAIELRPRFALAHLNRGLMALEAGDLVAAARDFGRASELDPSLALPAGAGELLRREGSD